MLALRLSSGARWIDFRDGLESIAILRLVERPFTQVNVIRTSVWSHDVHGSYPDQNPGLVNNIFNRSGSMSSDLLSSSL